MSSCVIPLLSLEEGGVHCRKKNERASLRNPISDTSGSGDETGQGDLRFLYSNILGNHDLKTASQESLLKTTIAFTAG